MPYLTAIVAQYNAALTMLASAVGRCPDSLWNAPEDRSAFWRVAYHALFYTHLYLQDSEKAFTPWAQHREEYQLGEGSQTPAEVVCPRDTVLAYADFCRAQVAERVPVLNLDSASGFFWLPLTRFELHLYTIRHLQQHTGELLERLGSRTGIDVDWVGSQPA